MFLFLCRFLTLLPPVGLKFQLGFASQPRPPPPPSVVSIVLSHPNTIRVAFVCFLSVVVVSYFAFLVHLSKLRHKRYMQSERIKNYSDRMACLRGHKQVNSGVFFLLPANLRAHFLFCSKFSLLLYNNHFSP